MNEDLLIQQINTMDKLLNELSIYSHHQSKELQNYQNKLDSILRENEITDKKVDEYINRGKGAWTIVLFLGSIAQVVIISLIAFVFNNVNINENSIILIKQQILDLQQDNEHLSKQLDTLIKIKK